MSQRDVALVAEALGEVADPTGTIDMKGTITERPPEPFVRVLDDDAEIRFLTAGGGTIGAMSGPFSGVEGFQAGWREWTDPFDTFTATLQSIEEGDEGRVLILVKTRARPRGGGPEVTDHTAALWTIDDGRVVAIDHYLDRDDARRAAGLAGQSEEEI